MSQGNGVVVAELAIPAKMPSSMSWAELERRIRNVGRYKKAAPWYIGDLLLLAEPYGEKASQLLNEFGYSQGALESFRWVSKKFPPEDRCDLPWGYHQAAAALPKRERDKALTMALKGELNRAGIRALANGASEPGNGLNRLPTAKEAAFEALGLAMATVAKLFRGDPDDETWLAALDELMETAAAVRENIAR